jgi:hypothetical protein
VSYRSSALSIGEPGCDVYCHFACFIDDFWPLTIGKRTLNMYHFGISEKGQNENWRLAGDVEWNHSLAQSSAP